MKRIYMLFLFVMLVGMVKGQIDLPGLGFQSENKVISSETEMSFIFDYPNNHSSNEIIPAINQVLQQQNINWTRAIRIHAYGSRWMLYFSVDVLSGTASREALIYSLFDYSYIKIVQTPPVVLQKYRVSTSKTKIFPGLEHEVQLNGSQAGVSYHLMLGNTTITSLYGTGSSLVFKFYPTLPGEYRIEAKYLNNSLMMGSVYLSLYSICNNNVVLLDSSLYILYKDPGYLDIKIHFNCSPEQLTGCVAELQTVVDYCNAMKILTWNDTLGIRLLPGSGNTRILTVFPKFDIDKICSGYLFFNTNFGVLNVVCMPSVAPRVWHHVREYTTVIPGNQMQEVIYVDNLGREMQRVSVGASPTGKDIIQPIDYDAVGRQSVKYLPYVASGNGNYRKNAVVQQDSFYRLRYGDSHHAFMETVYDNSVEDKVVEQSAPGVSWQLGGGHTTRGEYRVNESSDQVKKYELAGTGVALNGQYQAGSLWVVKVTDPQNNISIEYKDWNGNVIAKESRLTTGKRILTYNVYDGMGRLRYIIPPLQDSLFVSGTKTRDELSKYCYYSEYDDHGRLYKQYNPGAGYVITLYDKRGRLVLTQDVLERKNDLWKFTKYDVLDRPVITGRCSGTEAQHQAALQAQFVFGESRGATLHGYTNLTYPTSVTESNCLIVNYYDNYNWTGQTAVPYSSVDAIGNPQSNDALDLRTGSKIKVLGIPGDQWLLSATYYDREYRVVQTVAQLYPSGTEIASNSHNFTGGVTRVKVKQTVGSLVTEYNKYFTYDARGRLLKTEQQVAGDNTNGKVLLAENTYDELGRLASKKIHNNSQTIAYTYSIGGAVTNVTSPAFSYSLDYDNTVVTGASSRYDGNVNAMRWKNGSGTEKAYVYTYDALTQLTSALYRENSGGWSNSNNRYNVSGITYDRNGNIKGLTRNNSTGGVLHKLDYAYAHATNGNAMSSLTENGSTKSYVYDECGNMTSDGRRGVTISYNEINLPKEISKGTEKISYIYSADGEKLASQAGSSLTYYRGVMTYNGSALANILHPEGLIRKAGTSYVYNYQLRDHLGSTRVLLEASGKTLSYVQTMEYYPFGLAFSYNNLNVNKYLFSGKEYQDVALGGNLLGMYDFGARFYDPVVGRWFCQDPALQLVSPYGYCGNNPVAMIDPNGEFFWEAALIGAIFSGFCGGMKAEAQGKNFWSGAWKGAITGAVGGALSQVGGAGMSFAKNLLLGVGEGALTGGLDALLWKENIGTGALWGGASGAVWSTIFSENLENWGKGQGWKTNEKVFRKMIDSGVDKNTILQYFNFEGVYNPTHRRLGNNPAITDTKTGKIVYGDFSFEGSFDRLAFIADHELQHRQHVLSGKYKGVKIDDIVRGSEEWTTYLHGYRNSGLYRNHGIDLKTRINLYGLSGGIYEIGVSPGRNTTLEFTKKWWHIIYRTPRRW